MKRNSMVYLLLVAVPLVGLSAPAFAADYASQLAEYKKTNSGPRAEGILDKTNPLISAVLTSDSTHAQSNTTLANVAGLTLTLQSGKTYLVTAVLYTTANAAAGNKVDLGGGTLTVTSFRGLANVTTAAGTFTASRQTALTTGAASTADNFAIEVTGRLVVNAGGTLIVRHAQNVSGANNSTIYAGSYITAQKV